MSERARRNTPFPFTSSVARINLTTIPMGVLIASMTVIKAAHAANSNTCSYRSKWREGPVESKVDRAPPPARLSSRVIGSEDGTLSDKITIERPMIV